MLFLEKSCKNEWENYEAWKVSTLKTPKSHLNSSAAAAAVFMPPQCPRVPSSSAPRHSIVSLLNAKIRVVLRLVLLRATKSRPVVVLHQC